MREVSEEEIVDEEEASEESLMEDDSLMEEEGGLVNDEGALSQGRRSLQEQEAVASSSDHRRSELLEFQEATQPIT